MGENVGLAATGVTAGVEVGGAVEPVSEAAAALPPPPQPVKIPDAAVPASASELPTRKRRRRSVFSFGCFLAGIVYTVENPMLFMYQLPKFEEWLPGGDHWNPCLYMEVF